jgi:regulator of CtrA degradation
MVGAFEWELSLGERDLFRHGTGEPADFGRSFVSSEAFKALFREGMELVEQAATYLDGTGRRESAKLSPKVSLAYATESMRLTTRLMQIASWLLVQRAAADGDIGQAQVLQERDKLRAGAQVPATTTDPAEFEELPRGFRNLIGLSARLHARVLHIDLLIEEERPPAPVPSENPVAAQQSLIARAFGVEQG